jgi:antitoxin CptB
MSETNESPADQYRRLAWQCRRGIKEVEVVLVPFFEQHFLNLSRADQQLFEQLLLEQDVDMFEWFTKRTLPEQPDLARIVKKVLFGVDA